MAQLQISFDQFFTPAPLEEKIKFAGTPGVPDVTKVTHHTNITANVLAFMVSEGLFESDFDCELVAYHWALKQGESFEDDEDSENDSPSIQEVLEAYELLEQAMEEAEENAPRVCTAAMFVENVYYYYGMNSVLKKQSPLPYSDFMRACKSFTRVHSEY